MFLFERYDVNEESASAISVGRRGATYTAEIKLVSYVCFLNVFRVAWIAIPCGLAMQNQEWV